MMIMMMMMVMMMMTMIMTMMMIMIRMMINMLTMIMKAATTAMAIRFVQVPVPARAVIPAAVPGVRAAHCLRAACVVNRYAMVISQS
jgi:hypothetical protein